MNQSSEAPRDVNAPLVEMRTKLLAQHEHDRAERTKGKNEMTADPLAPWLDCNLCDALATSAHAHPGMRFDCLCGAVHLYEGPRIRCVKLVAPEARPRVKMTRIPRTSAPPADDRNRVLAYVADVLRWDRSVARVDSAQRGSASSVAGALEALRLGVLGSGNAGTKGVGHRPESDTGVFDSGSPIDPVAQARYRALTGDARRATDAVLADGCGDQFVDMAVGRRNHDGTFGRIGLTLAQRVAWILAPGEVLRKWNEKIAGGDTTPALKAASKLGEAALGVGAEAWWAAL